jgi:transposase
MKTPGRAYSKHTLAEKLEVIHQSKLGYGCSHISQRMSISETMVVRWLRRYRQFGLSGLSKPSTRTILSLSMKEKLVREVLEKSLSCQTVALRYQVSETAVHTWVTKVRQGGYAALTGCKKQSQPSTYMNQQKKKKQLPRTDLEKLEAEVLYLRAENAYLKKLRALVEERITRESGKSSKPSNH